MASKASSSKSPYFDSLDEVHSTRYREKLSLIDGLDPYAVAKDSVVFDVDAFPRVTYPDIVNYLVLSPSPFTKGGIRKFYLSNDCSTIGDIYSFGYRYMRVTIGEL